MRILRDPDPNASTGGGGTPAPTPSPTPAPTPQAPTPTPTPPPPPVSKIEVSPEEYKSFLDSQTRLAEIEAKNKRDAEEKETARLKALADKGEAEKALAELRAAKDKDLQTEREQRLATERELLAEKMGNTMNAALLGVNYSDEYAAQQVREILEQRIESVRGPDGKAIVRDKLTGKPAAEAIKEWLATPQAAKFLQATTQGGAGAGGTHRPAPAAPPAPVDPFERGLKAQLAANRINAPGLAGNYGNNAN